MTQRDTHTDTLIWPESWGSILTLTHPTMWRKPGFHQRCLTSCSLNASAFCELHQQQLTQSLPTLGQYQCRDTPYCSLSVTWPTSHGQFIFLLYCLDKCVSPWLDAIRFLCSENMKIGWCWVSVSQQMVISSWFRRWSVKCCSMMLSVLVLSCLLWLVVLCCSCKQIKTQHEFWHWAPTLTANPTVAVALCKVLP